MTPPNRFWPFYDEEDVEIYDTTLWDLPGRARLPKNSVSRKVRQGRRKDRQEIF